MTHQEQIEKLAKEYGEANNKVIAHGMYATCGDRELGFLAGSKADRELIVDRIKGFMDSIRIRSNIGATDKQQIELLNRHLIILLSELKQK